MMQESLSLYRTHCISVLGFEQGWVGFSEYRGSLAAFLFTWPDGDVTKKPIKLRKVCNALCILSDALRCFCLLNKKPTTHGKLSLPVSTSDTILVLE